MNSIINWFHAFILLCVLNAYLDILVIKYWKILKCQFGIYNWGSFIINHAICIAIGLKIV
mgnify:CR=1 FL=1